jgi:hypothetical protein
MVLGVGRRVSVIRGQRSDDRRHLKPVLLKKKIDKSDPYFVNYLRDATLGWLMIRFNFPDSRYLSDFYKESCHKELDHWKYFRLFSPALVG